MILSSQLLARVVPDSFRCIQFRPIGWKLKGLDVAAIRREPILGFLFCLGIRRAFVHQVDPAVPALEGGHADLMQER